MTATETAEASTVVEWLQGERRYRATGLTFPTYFEAEDCSAFLRGTDNNHYVPMTLEVAKRRGLALDDPERLEAGARYLRERGY